MTAQELVLTAFFLTKLVSFTPQLFTQLEQWLFNASESISSQLSLGRKSTRRFSRGNNVFSVFLVRDSAGLPFST